MGPWEREARQRQRETFSSLRLLPGAWTVLRLDGRAFTKFTAERFAKPFDSRFRDLMVEAACALFQDFVGVYACTHSDEISVAFPPGWNLFDRRVEKLASVSAAVVSAAFTRSLGEAVHFDSRIWQGVSMADVVDYFLWRQDDSARCALHGWCYWSLRRTGMSGEAARRELEGKGWSAQNELLFRLGVNFNDVPTWQRRGVGLYWQPYEKTGWNPITGEMVAATRRAVRKDLDLPKGAGYEALLLALLAGRQPENAPG